MNRNLRIYEHEAERSHAQEIVVASAWAFLLIVMFAASLLDQPTKPIAPTELHAVSAVVPLH
jgi:hypothetical protein